MKIYTKIIIAVLAVVLIAGGIVGGFMLGSRDQYISKQQALDIALKDANVELRDVLERDVELEREHGRAWYEVDFDVIGRDYSYVIDPVSGQILGGGSEPDFG